MGGGTKIKEELGDILYRQGNRIGGCTKKKGELGETLYNQGNYIGAALKQKAGQGKFYISGEIIQKTALK